MAESRNKRSPKQFSKGQEWLTSWPYVLCGTRIIKPRASVFPLAQVTRVPAAVLEPPHVVVLLLFQHLLLGYFTRIMVIIII